MLAHAKIQIKTAKPENIPVKHEIPHATVKLTMYISNNRKSTIACICCVVMPENSSAYFSPALISSPLKLWHRIKTVEYDKKPALVKKLSHLLSG